MKKWMVLLLFAGLQGGMLSAMSAESESGLCKKSEITVTWPELLVTQPKMINGSVYPFTIKKQKRIDKELQTLVTYIYVPEHSLWKQVEPHEEQQQCDALEQYYRESCANNSILSSQYLQNQRS